MGWVGQANVHGRRWLRQGAGITAAACGLTEAGHRLPHMVRRDGLAVADGEQIGSLCDDAGQELGDALLRVVLHIV